MFAVIYRGYVKLGREEDYKKLWHMIASYFIKHRGAIGSCLHKAEDGSWVAYSRWPDKAARDSSWPGENAPAQDLPQEIQEAIAAIKDCIDSSRKFPELCLEIIDDLLLR